MSKKGLSKSLIWIALGMLMVAIVFGILLLFQQYTQRAIEPTLEGGESGGAGGGAGFSSSIDGNYKEALDTSTIRRGES